MSLEHEYPQRALEDSATCHHMFGELAAQADVGVATVKVSLLEFSPDRKVAPTRNVTAIRHWISRDLFIVDELAKLANLAFTLAADLWDLYLLRTMLFEVEALGGYRNGRPVAC